MNNVGEAFFSAWVGRVEVEIDQFYRFNMALFNVYIPQINIVDMMKNL